MKKISICKLFIILLIVVCCSCGKEKKTDDSSKTEVLIDNQDSSKKEESSATSESNESSSSTQKSDSNSSESNKKEDEDTETPVPTQIIEEVETPIPTQEIEDTETPVPTQEIVDTATPEPTRATEKKETPVPTKTEVKKDTPIPTKSVKNTDTPVPTKAAQNTKSPTQHVHDFGDWEVQTEATCQKEGVAIRKCRSCDKTESKKIAKSSHVPVKDDAVAAGCTTTGKTEGSHCSVCGQVITAQKTVKATGHNYNNGVCTKCGAADPNYVREYKLGETWVVDGQWEFTINKVEEHTLCNSYTNERKGYDTNELGAVLITYSYKNLGYNRTSELYMPIYLCSNIYDNEGYVVDSYACTHENSPAKLKVNTRCDNASSCFVIRKEAKSIVIYLEHRGDNKEKYTAIYRINLP